MSAHQRPTPWYAADRCAVCREGLAADERCVDAFLRVLVHRRCSAVIDAMQRSYDQSPRGRWRTRAEVLRALAEYHAARPVEENAR